MDYQKLSKEIAESFKDLILTFSDDNEYKEDFIRKEIEDYGCDFDKPDIKLANSAIRCAMDYCGLDFSMVRWIMLKPKDYAMPFEPLSEQEILMFTDPTDSKVYDPYFYEHEGKEYITFSTIEAVHSNGIVRSTHEYNLRYSVTDNEWYGDVVRHGDWEDIDSNEAFEIAKEYDLIFIAKEVINEKADTGKETEGKLLNAIFVRPDTGAKAAFIRDDLTVLREWVGGNIEVIYPFEDEIGIICNEDGKNMRLPMNRALYDSNGDIYDIIAGDFLVVGISEDGFVSLSDELYNKYMDYYIDPETFVNMGGKFVVFRGHTKELSPSLESESHDAMSASEEISKGNSHRKQNPQVR